MRRRILLFAMIFAWPTIAGEPVILLTGFEPLKNAKMNSSWEAIRGFQGKMIAGHRVETLQLPYVYDAVEAPLKEAISKFKPAAVLCFAEGARSIRIETVALNSYGEFKPLDNKGLPPPREKIIFDGADALKSGLPLDALYNVLRSPDFIPVLSEFAGGTVPNECFYRLIRMPEAPAVRGLIHLPEIGERDPTAGGYFSLEVLQTAVVNIVSSLGGKPPMRTLALGDGYSSFQLERGTRWVGLLLNRMRNDGEAIAQSQFIPDSQATIKAVSEGLSTIKEKKFDCVFLQIGMRDLIQGVASRNFSIAEILMRAKEWGEPTIIVLSIPDFTVTKWGRMNGYNAETAQKKLREFNATLAAECKEAGAQFVDITADTVKFADDPKYTFDGYNYPEPMHEIWAQSVYNALKAKKLLLK